MGPSQVVPIPTYVRFAIDHGFSFLKKCVLHKPHDIDFWMIDEMVAPIPSTIQLMIVGGLYPLAYLIASYRLIVQVVFPLYLRREAIA
jgi:hypothetical protein